MFRHETESMDAVIILSNAFSKQQGKMCSVGFDEKYILSAFATKNHMIKTTWNMNPRLTCHVNL